MSPRMNAVERLSTSIVGRDAAGTESCDRRLRLALPCLLALATGCQCAGSEVEARLSGVVAFAYQGTDVAAWLEQPGLSTVEVWAHVPADVGDDVIFGLDQEYIDGVPRPFHLAKGDWMALVGVQRTGAVWIAVGTEATEAGTPSRERTWVLESLGQPLQADTWYRLRGVADMNRRRYVSFRIEGPGLDRTFDLSAHRLDYPNEMPFSGRTMTYYAFSLRGRSLGGSNATSGRVYFDGLRGAVRRGEADVTVVETGFEGNTGAIPPQPLEVSAGLIQLERYQEGVPYLEREESRCRVDGAGLARQGAQVLACDATLEGGSMEDWLRRPR